MNLGDAKTKVLSLINSKSDDGVIVSTADNADYLIRMNDLFDDAQKELSRIAKISGSVQFVQTADLTQVYQAHAMPADFQELDRVTFATTDPAFNPNFVDFGWQQPNVLLFPSSYEGTFTAYYWKKPTTIPPAAAAPDAADTQDFDISDEAVIVACYYVAGHLLLDENAGMANALLNDYAARKMKLVPPRYFAPQTIQNVYGNFNW